MTVLHLIDILAQTPNVFQPYLTTHRGYVTLADYHAGGDDWSNAFQNAMDALKATGGTLFVPRRATYYQITRPIVVYSNCRIISNGAEVRNTASDNAGANFWKAAVFFMGTFTGHGSASSLFQLPVTTTCTGPVAEQTQTITVVDAAAIDVGSIIVVESVERVFTSYPAHAFVNTVLYKSGNTLTLKHPIKAAFGSGGNPRVYVVPTSPDTSPLNSSLYTGKTFLAHNSSIEGLNFGASDALTTPRYGQSIHFAAYECSLVNCRVEGGKVAVGGNPFAHSTIMDCRIRAQDRGAELAYLTHDSLIRDTDIGVINIGMDTDADGASYALRFGSEGGHDNAVEGGRMSYMGTGTGATSGQPAVGLTGPRSSIRGTQVFGGSKLTALATASDGSVVADNRVYGGTAFGISVFGLAAVTGNIVQGNRSTASIKKNTPHASTIVADNVLGDGSHASHVVV